MVAFRVTEPDGDSGMTYREGARLDALPIVFPIPAYGESLSQASVWTDLTALASEMLPTASRAFTVNECWLPGGSPVTV